MTLSRVAPTAASLRLLGGVSLTIDGEPRLARRLKTLALLGCLARAPGGRCRRPWLADLLWAEAGDERARHSLRQALAELRRHLGDAIRTTPERAWLERDGVSIDVDHFDAAVAAGDWAGAVAAWAGDFLAGADGAGGAPFAEWLQRERETLRARLALACTHLVADAREAGDVDAALGHAERWVALLPGDERGHRAVVELLAQSGRTGEAAVAHAGAVAALQAEETGASSEFLRLAGALGGPARAARRAPGARGADVAGRASLADLVAEAWDRVAAGGGTVLVVEGEEGLGKSHALRHAEAWLATRLPATRIRVARALTAERLEGGSLLRRLAGEPVAHGDAAPALDRLVAAADAATPLALLVDDAALADTDSQSWLARVAREAPPHVLLVLAMRPLALADARLRPALRHNPAARTVHLGPMTPEETAAFVRERHPASDGDVTTLAERLHRDGRGIPVVIEAALGLLEEDGYLARAGEGWRLARELPIGGLCLPADARERARRHLRRLPPAAKTVLEVAALAGEVVDERLVLRVAALAEPAEALGELERRRLLVRATHPAGTLEFTAAGVRQAVFDQLLPQRREQLRRAVEHGHRQLRDAGHRAHLPRALADVRPRFAFLRATIGVAARVTGVAALLR